MKDRREQKLLGKFTIISSLPARMGFKDPGSVLKDEQSQAFSGWVWFHGLP